MSHLPAYSTLCPWDCRGLQSEGHLKVCVLDSNRKLPQNNFLYFPSKIGVQGRSVSHIRPGAPQSFFCLFVCLDPGMLKRILSDPTITMDAPPSKSSTLVDTFHWGWIEKGFLHTANCLPRRWERFGCWATDQKANTGLILEALRDPVQFWTEVQRRVCYWIRIPAWTVCGAERGGQMLVGTRTERAIAPRVGYLSPTIGSLPC